MGMQVDIALLGLSLAGKIDPLFHCHGGGRGFEPRSDRH
jgi:hypothetical protein